MIHEVKRTVITVFQIRLIIISISLNLFVCVAVPSDKNIENLKGKGLKEVDPSYWEKTRTVSVYNLPNCFNIAGPMLGPVRGNIDLGSTIKDGILSGIIPIFIMGPLREENDKIFQEKINSYLQSYCWKSNEYFYEIIKQKIHLSKAEKISFIDGLFESYEKMIQPADKHIIIVPSLFMGGARSAWKVKVFWQGSCGVSVATEEALQHFLKNCNTLPLPRVWGPKITVLSRMKMFPGLYMTLLIKYPFDNMLCHI